MKYLSWLKGSRTRRQSPRTLSGWIVSDIKADGQTVLTVNFVQHAYDTISVRLGPFHWCQPISSFSGCLLVHAQFVFWLFNVLSILRCGGFRCWFIHAYLPLFRLTSIAPPYLCWSGTGKESGRMVFTDVDYKNQAWFYYLRSKNHPSAFCSHPPSPRLACICWVYSCGMVRMSGTASGWTPVGPAGGGRWELLVFCCIWLGLRARCAGIGTGKESGRMVFTS